MRSAPFLRLADDRIAMAQDEGPEAHAEIDEGDSGDVSQACAVCGCEKHGRAADTVKRANRAVDTTRSGRERAFV